MNESNENNRPRTPDVSEPDFSTVLRRRPTAKPNTAGQTNGAGVNNAPRPRPRPAPTGQNAAGQRTSRSLPEERPHQKASPTGDTRVMPAVSSTAKPAQTAKPVPARANAPVPRAANQPRGNAPSVDWTAPSKKASPATARGQSRAVGHTSMTSAQSAVMTHNAQGAPNARKKKASKKHRDSELQEAPRTGMLNSVLKAIIYIMFILVTSGFLSYFGITVCNDVFAFVKDTSEVEVTIPQNATIDDVKKILSDADVISYPSIFKLYSSLRKDNGKYVAGNYTVSPAMNYDMLLKAFKEVKPERTELRITIPEGLTVDDTIALLVEKGIGTRERYIDVINNYDYDFWFMDSVNEIWSHHGEAGNPYEQRKYRLEGYLFPDTYYFFSDSNEETVVYKLLLRFSQLFTQELRDRCTELNYSVDQIVTLASIVQAEAKYEAEYKTISSVFWNRLNNPNYETVGKLDSDATVQYIFDEHKTDLTQEDTAIDNPYNTYVYKGLPPSAICNPCYSAILRAMYPASTNYYYFVAQKNGYSLFATTYQQHVQNKLKALS